MKELNFSVEINAPIEKVWDILWNDATYNQWTKHFNADSHIESDWKVGGKTLFLDGERNGMISTIKEMDKPNKIVFEHYGELNKGVEDTTSDRVKSYAGSLEKYYLQEHNGTTNLQASVQTFEDYEQMMNNGFTKGLQEVKQLAEG